jgi:hypothetical protein
MEHSGDTDPCAEMLGIGGDDHHRLRSRLEQQVIDHRLVLEGDVSDLGGQREDHVEVSHRQQVKRHVDLAQGRFALIEKSREFTLVPWRDVLEKQIGKQVGGIMRESGVSWTIGRGRSGPVIW